MPLGKRITLHWVFCTLLAPVSSADAPPLEALILDSECSENDRGGCAINAVQTQAKLHRNTDGAVARQPHNAPTQKSIDHSSNHDASEPLGSTQDEDQIDKYRSPYLIQKRAQDKAHAEASNVSSGKDAAEDEDDIDKYRSPYLMQIPDTDQTLAGTAHGGHEGREHSSDTEDDDNIDKYRSPYLVQVPDDADVPAQVATNHHEASEQKGNTEDEDHIDKYRSPYLMQAPGDDHPKVSTHHEADEEKSNTEDEDHIDKYRSPYLMQKLDSHDDHTHAEDPDKEDTHGDSAHNRNNEHAQNHVNTEDEDHIDDYRSPY